MSIAFAPLAATLAGLLLQAAPAGPGPGEGTSELRLRAHAADAATLLMFVFADSRRLLVSAPGVGAPVTLDVTRPAPEAVEEAALRAAGAPYLELGQVVVAGDKARIEAARTSPLRPLLEKGGSKSRQVKLQFRGIVLSSLLGLFADVGKRRFALAEGIDGKVVVATGGRPWTEVLDAALVSADLTRDEVDQVLRIRRRGDPAPRFTPLEVRLKEAQADAKPPRRPPGPCLEPQGFHDLASLRLAATLTGGKAPRALLALPQDGVAVVQAGSCAGADGGRVVRVEPERLVVERRRPDGTAGAETVTLELPGG